MEDRIPPITTVASGRWTSDPVPVAKAIGMNPRAATIGVISTGRKRYRPFKNRLRNEDVLFP